MRAAERLGWRAWKEKRGHGEDAYELCLLQAPGDKEPWEGYRQDVREEQRLRYTETTVAVARRIGFHGSIGVPAWTESLDLCARDIVPYAQHVLGYVLEVKFGPLIPTARFYPDPDLRFPETRPSEGPLNVQCVVCSAPAGEPCRPECVYPMNYLATGEIAAHAVVEAFLTIPSVPLAQDTRFRTDREAPPAG